MSEEIDETPETPEVETPEVDPWSGVVQNMQTVGFNPEELDAMELRKASNLAAALTSPDQREDAIGKLLANDLGGMSWQEAQGVLAQHREAAENPWAGIQTQPEPETEDYTMGFEQPAPGLDPAQIEAAVEARVAASERQMMAQFEQKQVEAAQIAEFHQSIERTATEHGLDDARKNILMRQAAALGGQPGMENIGPADLVKSAWGELDAVFQAAATQAVVEQVTEAPETTLPAGSDGSDVQAVPQNLEESAAAAREFFSE